MPLKKPLCLLLLSLLLQPLSTAFANHGPGTTGGGATTLSGETLMQGKFVFSLDEHYTNYKNISREKAEAEALKSGEFDAIRDGYFTNLSFMYGVAEDLQLEAMTGWYSGRGFVDAHVEEEGHESSSLRHGDPSRSAESAVGSPEGFSDLVVRGKYRVVKGAPGNLSLIGGGVFPTGNNGERLSNGERLEPSSQPGTGAFGFQGGLAYSRFLTSSLTLDTSSVYTHRFEHDNFQVGSRIDSGVALAYRFSNSVQDFPHVSIFTDITHVHIGKDQEENSSNGNSGGDTLFLTPGARIRFNDQVSFSAAPSFPVAQRLNGNQLETEFRVIGQLTVGL